MLGRFCSAEPDLASNLLNKIQFTFKVVPCLISDNFFTGVHQFWPSITRGECVGGREGQVGVGDGRWGGRWQNPPNEDTGPPVTPRWS